MDMDELVLLAEEMGAQLKQRKEVLALAESCTGGLAAVAITSVAGSSAWFDCGFVTYSNQSKVDALGVSAQTLDEYGAVSEQTAVAMAQGALKNSQATLAGSITGIAGPSGGTKQKPVGTVCFAWAHADGRLKRSTQLFRGDRMQIRHQAAEHMLLGLMGMLK
nr:CinA family protein [Methylotenera sp. 1P/1]